jgi:hypothetical protein
MWPKALPVCLRNVISCNITLTNTQILLIHGTADKVSSHDLVMAPRMTHGQVCSADATKRFYEAIAVDDKKLSLYEVNRVVPSPS